MAAVTFLRLLGRSGAGARNLLGGSRCFGVRTSPTGEKVTHTGQVTAVARRAPISGRLGGRGPSQTPGPAVQKPKAPGFLGLAPPCPRSSAQRPAPPVPPAGPLGPPSPVLAVWSPRPRSPCSTGRHPSPTIQTPRAPASAVSGSSGVTVGRPLLRSETTNF